MKGMNKIPLILAYWLIFFIPVTVVMGASNSFSVGMVILDDFPPTAPILLSTEPIAFDTIALTWSTSIDELSVHGYEVIRDGSPIATTSLTNFVDTGLTASTTYSYAIRAFDNAYNYSSTSNSLSTTTPESPPTPAPAVEPKTDSSASIARVVLRGLAIETGTTTMMMKIETAEWARIEVRWGRTGMYELGYVVQNSLKRKHQVFITELEPATKYQYEIVGYTPRGLAMVLETGAFSTKSGEAGTTLPINVSSFLAVANGTDVNLSWRLPPGEIAQVRVVRSYLGFPAHPLDGKIIFQGKAERALDESILAQYSTVYYTAFVYDHQGNVSSGAVAVVRVGKESEAGTDAKPTGSIADIKPGTFDAIKDYGSTTQATSSLDRTKISEGMKVPELKDVKIMQSNDWQLFSEEVTLSSNKVFTVVLPKQSVSGNLKSIIVTVVVGNNEYGSYLLRLNQDGTAYEAMVEVSDAGEGLLELAIYDYYSYVVASYVTPARFVAGESGGVDLDDKIDRSITLSTLSVVAIVFLIAVFILLLTAWRRRTEDKD